MKVWFIFLCPSGLLTKSGSDSSLSEEDELKRRGRGKKETEAQGEEKESCSDEEKNKESIDIEVEQCTGKGMAVKNSPSIITDTGTDPDYNLCCSQQLVDDGGKEWGGTWSVSITLT